MFTVQQLKKIAGELNLSCGNFTDFVGSLNNQGYLLQKGSKTYQLMTSASHMKYPFCFALAATMVTTAATFTAPLSISQCTTSGGCKPSQKRVALDSTSNGTEKLVQVSGNSLTLGYGGAVVGGPRVYLIDEEGMNKNTLVMLKNQEFTFDVELSTMPCGFNAALYFVGMNANEGGAENGTNYCD
eukprot:gene6300-27644_t